MKIKVNVKYDVTESFINTEFIRLDSLLKFENIAETGGIAKDMIQNGEIKVNGEVCMQRGKKLRPGDFVTLGRKKIVIKAEENNI